MENRAAPFWATRVVEREAKTDLDAPFQNLITEAAWGTVWGE